MVGRTFADLFWRVLSNRYAVWGLVGAVLSCVVLVALGIVDVTWGKNGVHLSSHNAVR
jgi:hypothetical protein